MKVGAIISGYQGIGKSTLSHNHPLEVLDLESSNFFVDGIRHEDWYKVYGNIALDLALQGHVVLISSHKNVRDYIKDISDKEDQLLSVHLFTCFPDYRLKYEWVDRLRSRYDRTKSPKDFKAYANAASSFDANIKNMYEQEGFFPIVIKDMNYDLACLIREGIMRRT